ncbi:ELYS domain-containing protein [Mycena kentingensis (nom. inval.)]|nr:ELYS domain-containing protein [Mycena kentingensis (nom. inval.)]
MSSPPNYVASILAHFETGETFPWTPAVCKQIEQRRGALNDLLLFDILLRSGGIREPDTFYPPKDPDEFHRLLEAIHLSTYDTLKQDCLAYFLLKWYRDGREERFKLERAIPPHFAALSDAYFALDAGVGVPQAVSNLSDSRINTDYASKILQAISLSENAMPLVLKYVQTAKPLLTEPEDIDLYTLALAESNLSDAWRFQRTFSEQNPTRPRLLTKILEWCFAPPRRNALQQLLGIALTPYEQGFIEKFATPPSSLSPIGMATLQNLLCVRFIQSGLFVDAIKLDRHFSGASPAAANLPQQAERTKMVQEVYAALPLAERSLLDVELETPVVQAKPGPPPPVKPARDMDTSMSWEDISMAQIPVPFNTPQRPPLFGSPAVPLNGRTHELPLSGSTFGGFGNTSTRTPSAFPPLSFSTTDRAASTSSTAAQPIVPISTSKPPVVPIAPANAFSTLAKSTARPFGGSSAGGSLFESANRRQNAFYQPPATTTPSVFKEIVPPPPAPEAEMVEQPMNGDDANASGDDGDDDEPMEEEETQADESLAYSVFSSNKPLARAARQPPPAANKRSRKSTAAKEAKRAPPGAFITDDDETEDMPPPPQAPEPTRSRQTRSSAKSAPTAPAAASAPKTTRSRAKGKKNTQTIPGSLMGSEEEENEASEEEEEIAPLPTRRAVAASETRRRSSRLSSVEPESASAKGSSSKAPARTKAATGGRKRRT